MAAESVAALGTTVAYSLDGTAYVTIGQITSVSHSGGSEIGERDTTVLSSTRKSMRPTIPDGGELSFEFNFDSTDTAHAQVKTWANVPAAADVWWKVTYSDTEEDIMKGWVKNFDGVNAGGVDENNTATVTVRVNDLL